MTGMTVTYGALQKNSTTGEFHVVASTDRGDTSYRICGDGLRWVSGLHRTAEIDMLQATPQSVKHRELGR